MRWRLHGLRAWLWQRLTALYMAAFMLIFFIAFAVKSPSSYEGWRDFMTHPVINTGVGLFFVALLIHAWVGIRDVIVDYVHPWVLRFGLLVLLGMFLLGMGLWVLHILHI